MRINHQNKIRWTCNWPISWYHTLINHALIFNVSSVILRAYFVANLATKLVMIIATGQLRHTPAPRSFETPRTWCFDALRSLILVSPCYFTPLLFMNTGTKLHDFHHELPHSRQEDWQCLVMRLQILVQCPLLCVLSLLFDYYWFVSKKIKWNSVIQTMTQFKLRVHYFFLLL